MPRVRHVLPDLPRSAPHEHDRHLWGSRSRPEFVTCGDRRSLAAGRGQGHVATPVGFQESPEPVTCDDLHSTLQA